MPETPALIRPNFAWRLGSQVVLGSVGAASKGFLYAFNTVHVEGLENLLGVIERRKSRGRDRGLLTVCNHVAVLDDPLIWGILPLRYAFSPENIRWGLGAHDICFKNKFTSTFFSLGQILPTYRSWHSAHGGIYQPTMSQAISLLSSPTASTSTSEKSFSPGAKESIASPAAYESNRYAWVHVFPEACCHQSDDLSLRYFKWGVSRLILESDPAPEFIPMFIDGTQAIMPEDRGFPRFLPRIGNRIRVAIGKPVDSDKAFGDYRQRWKSLAEKATEEDKMNSPEAIQLRIDVAKAVRDEVLKLRESLGFPREEDETAALADTWSKEPNKRKFKSPVDGSLVNRH